MADDAEMTLIPSNTEPATGSAAAEPPKQDTTFGVIETALRAHFARQIEYCLPPYRT
jgi:hypothetical protein